MAMTNATTTQYRGPKQMSEQDMHDHVWVDDWLRSQPPQSQRWTSQDWKQHFVKLSKTLSYILRHGADDQNLKVRRDGYISVAVLLNHNQFKNFGYTEADVEVAVAQNAKQRFALKREGDVLLICAQQGHSSKVGDIDQRTLNTILDVASVPDCVIHGTFWTNLTAILTEGLKKMERDHVHMAAGMPSAEIKSGIRKESDTILEINVRKAIADGIEFFLSGNGVILTEGLNGVLPPEYITCVMDRSGRVVDRPAQFPKSVKWPERAMPSLSAALQQRAMPSQVNSTMAAPSQLTLTEKDFLKVVKKVRAILKIKETGAKDKIQEAKLETLGGVLEELAEAEQRLRGDSDLREKNNDVLTLCQQ